MIRLPAPSMKARHGLNEIRALVSAEVEAGNDGAFGKKQGGSAKVIRDARAGLEWLDEVIEELFVRETSGEAE